MLCVYGVVFFNVLVLCLWPQMLSQKLWGTPSLLPFLFPNVPVVEAQ